MTLVARDLSEALRAAPAQSAAVHASAIHASAVRTNPRATAIPAETGLHAAPQRLYAGGLKRALDLFLVVLTAPVWLPLILVGAALIFLADGAAPFYFQKRVGRGGRSFWLWKLRSMVPDADARLEAHLAADAQARAEWDANQKLKRDPRITWAGRFLRKTSLDELPQLVNVLKGDMSLVGPRPMMAEQKRLYHGRAYYRLRPGLTGPWQVSERHQSLFADRVHYDEAYAADMSLGTDLGLLVRTVGVVVRGTGC